MKKLLKNNKISISEAKRIAKELSARKIAHDKEEKLLDEAIDKLQRDCPHPRKEVEFYYNYGDSGSYCNLCGKWL